MAWPDWVCDPDIAKASEVAIRFTSERPGTTMVQLEHSKLERHGEGYEKLREAFRFRMVNWSALLRASP